jgi:bacteriocin leader peptide (microcyclamide/patellamide family)
MDKKDLSPKQPKPVVRPSISKPSLEGLSEEALTQGWSGASSALTPSITCTLVCIPFAGDDAE